MNPPPDPSEPSSGAPTPSPRPAGREGIFVLQAIAGLALVGATALAGFGFKATAVLEAGCYILPFVGIILCLIRPVRGLGCGILLGCGLAALIVGAICASALKNI